MAARNRSWRIRGGSEIVPRVAAGGRLLGLCIVCYLGAAERARFANDAGRTGARLANDARRTGARLANDAGWTGARFANDAGRTGAQLANDAGRTGARLANDAGCCCSVI